MNWKINSLYTPLMTIATFVVWSVSAGILFALTTSEVASENTAGSATASMLFLLLTCFVTVLVAVWFINRSRLNGLSLALQIFVMFFGTMFFMSQIETLYFRDAVAMPMSAVAATLGSGFFVALALAGQGVLLRHALGTVAKMPPKKVRNRVIKFALLSLIYLAIYFLFGYFVAWQVPEIRQYYAGSSDIVPFIDHLKSVLRNDSALPLFQLVRGIIWAAIAYSIAINTTHIQAIERMLLVAIALSVPLAVQLLLPNPYMPDVVRMGHFYEVLFSQLLFGLIAGWFFRATD